VKTGLPSGLTALLGKLGIGVGQPGQTGKPGETKVAEKGLQAGGPKDPKAEPGVEKGTALGDGALLAGLGHNVQDKKTALRNIAEQANIDRFLQDPHTGAEAKDAKESPATQREDRMRDARDPKEARELREFREELRREERLDDAKMQAFQEQKTEKEREKEREAKERERQRDDREKDRDEDEKHGSAWLQEELEREEEEQRRRGVRDEDALGGYTRCRGHLDDGTQCLRKPVQGTPYCREHAFGH
jgi:hypothetical protein